MSALRPAFFILYLESFISRLNVIQMFWQQLLSQPRCFLEQAGSFLASEKVHYYYKCTVWEVLGQVNTPSPDIFAFFKAYWNDENWKSIILHNVFWKHIAFIRQYIADDFAYSWMEPTALWLLRSVAKEEQSFVREALAPCIGKNQEDDQAILNVFGFALNQKEKPSTCIFKF